MKIREFSLAELTPAPYNPRNISEVALKGLEASLERFGYLQPIIVNVRKGQNIVVGGNQRLKALTEAGEATAPCIVVDFDLTTEKAALNSEAISGDWTNELGKLLTELLILTYVFEF